MSQTGEGFQTGEGARLVRGARLMMGGQTGEGARLEEMTSSNTNNAATIERTLRSSRGGCHQATIAKTCE